MKEIQTDIIIIGGGLIGAVCAISLSNIGYRVTILEKNNLKINQKNHLDTRTVAISEGTKIFLNKIKIWKDLKNFSEEIKNIKIIDRNPSNYLDFDNSRRDSNLGYIIKNKLMLGVFYKKIKSQTNVSVIDNVKNYTFENIKDKIFVNLKNLKIKADIIIAADGKNSFVRNALKTTIFKKNYNKKALVLTLTHSKSHSNTAFEFFFKNGPLAILPMKNNNKTYNSSIVWTDQANYLESILKMDENKLISILNKKTKNCLGMFKKINSKQLFDLSAHINSKFYENRVVYVGDSAHSFHPIAGQGWNLGMKDVEYLYDLSKKYKLLGLSIGDKEFCKNYNTNTFYKAYRLYQLTDKLDLVFQTNTPFSNFIRQSGINLLQKNTKLKNYISDFAMGF